MREKGFAPILIIILIAAVVGMYLIYSGKMNLNKSQSVDNKTSEVSLLNHYPSELQGYPIYPGSKYIKKEIKSPSDYLDFYCSGGNHSIDCTGNTANYIFEVDIPSDISKPDNVKLQGDFQAWYHDPKNLFGWKPAGGAEGIRSYKKNNDSFEFLWGLPVSGSTFDYSKTQFTIRIPIK